MRSPLFGTAASAALALLAGTHTGAITHSVA
ncbi:hypothetical protein J2853_003312 [Streptosporangium lutulentum]|uniref:Uncharacterized protein n=1 Tax=Streptosporangium lutulentum TaxID=1461250 RepID=A0ABT9QCK6_9ACTN|nr:hypothetical protein [Streptosporangium lutulentum]